MYIAIKNNQECSLTFKSKMCCKCCFKKILSENLDQIKICTICLSSKKIDVTS